MFSSSTRNRVEIQVALLEKLDCKILMTPEIMSEATKDVLSLREMRKYMLPELGHFLDDKAVEKYAYDKSWEDTREESRTHMLYCILRVRLGRPRS